MQEVVDESASTYFHGVARIASRKNSIKAVIVVTHAVPGVYDFLQALNKYIRVVAVIAKPSSRDPKSLHKIRESFAILNYSREYIKTNPATVLSGLRELLHDESFAIIDTGGYFAPCIQRLCDEFGGQFYGVVEDTENGHQKYEQSKRALKGQLPRPVLSVARSDLKEAEDYLVGHAIVFSAEAVLRQFSEILTGQVATVLGFGKIGRSIAHALQARHVQVIVVDIDPIKKVCALSHGFQVADKLDALSSASLIFCATGNRSISFNDLKLTEQECYVFCATSADDEIHDIAQIYAHCERTNGAHLVLNKKRARTWLCNGGNSINFMHGGVVGHYIKLVQGELTLALSELQRTPAGNVAAMPNEAKQFLADLWINAFHDNNRRQIDYD